MKTLHKIAIAASLAIMATGSVFAQNTESFYNTSAGQNVIYKDYGDYTPVKAAPMTGGSTTVNESEHVEMQLKAKQEEQKRLRDANLSYKVVKEVDKKTGTEVEVRVEREKVATDNYGNAVGSQFDLAMDGAFKGQNVVVLQLYAFDFSKPIEALKEKGFSTFVYTTPPTPEQLKQALDRSSQFWLISSNVQMLNEGHLEVIKEFFDKGHGVYIWGDNDPYYADANYVGAALLDITMSGNLQGSQTVGLKDDSNTSGIRQNHLITTGMNYVYEGITIATVAQNEHLTPLVWGSAGNLVTAVYEQDGKRAIFDGGFTRLYNGWDTAGTGRYVKNAASWLANAEKFGGEWKGK